MLSLRLPELEAVGEAHLMPLIFRLSIPGRRFVLLARPGLAEEELVVDDTPDDGDAHPRTPLYGDDRITEGFDVEVASHGKSSYDGESGYRRSSRWSPPLLSSGERA